MAMSFDFSHLLCSQIKVHENLHSARIFLLQIFLKQSSVIAFNNAIYCTVQTGSFCYQKLNSGYYAKQKTHERGKNFISCVMNVIFDPHF